MDLKDIQNLIKFVAKSGVGEVRLEMDNVKVTIKTGTEGVKAETTYIQQIPANALPLQAPAAPVAPPAAAPSPTAAPVANTSQQITIKSPMIGTLYRKSGPDKPPFVDVGSIITKGDVLCVIEAMKLFNEIEAEVAGKIVKVLVGDSSPVEFDQPLFLVEPS